MTQRHCASTLVDPETLCFYTRIYDEGKKSIVSVRLSEIYNVPEEQVLLGYGGEDILKNAVHYYLMKGDNKTILIPEFSWWYYNRIAGECGGNFEMYPLHQLDDTFAYDVEEVIEYTNRIHPRMLLLASPNNPTGNCLTPEEIGKIMENIPADTMVLIDEAYASFISTDTDYIAPLVNKYSNLIISRTLSKFYGLPGLRMGFGFMGKGHENFLSYANKYLGYNRFTEAVAIAALESDDHYRKVADDMEWDRQLFKKELGNLPGQLVVIGGDREGLHLVQEAQELQGFLASHLDGLFHAGGVEGAGDDFRVGAEDVAPLLVVELVFSGGGTQPAGTKLLKQRAASKTLYRRQCALMGD